MNTKVNVCFVCMGNICRSPTAEAVMKHLVAERGLASLFTIESAGIGDWHVGDAADARSQETALRRGYSLESRAQQFSHRFFDRFDYILAADKANRKHLQQQAPDEPSRKKIFLLRDFDPASPKGSDVPDPYYGGPEGFEHVVDICEAACRGLLDHICSERRQ